MSISAYIRSSQNMNKIMGSPTQLMWCGTSSASCPDGPYCTLDSTAPDAPGKEECMTGKPKQDSSFHAALLSM